MGNKYKIEIEYYTGEGNPYLRANIPKKVSLFKTMLYFGLNSDSIWKSTNVHIEDFKNIHYAMDKAYELGLLYIDDLEKNKKEIKTVKDYNRLKDKNKEMSVKLRKFSEPEKEKTTSRLITVPKVGIFGNMDDLYGKKKKEAS